VYEHLGTPIAVLPNAVADEILTWQLRTPPKVFTVGYQGSPSHLYDMQYWVGAFDAFMDAAPRARWHWFGLHDPKCWPTHRQKVTPWINSAEQFHRSLNGRFHVGVAPLHPGLEFNRYKSGLKAQVYGALGRPTVASDVSYYRDTIQHGRTGFIVSSPAQWKEALVELYRDPGKAETMGMHARDLEATRVMSRVVHKWETAYREALCLK
jgi:glycosyltransferase involved in cell wall biosynthesis